MTERNNTCVASAMQRQYENFIKLANMVHEDSNLDFSNIVFSGFNSFLEIECRKHGKTRVVARQVLGGRGCVGCKHEAEFMYEAAKKFKNKYDLSKVKLRYKEDHIQIGCKVHGFVTQQGSSFLRVGCKECAPKSFGASKKKYTEICSDRHNSKSNLYILRCFGDGEEFYKIGISAAGVKVRFTRTRIPYKYEVVRLIKGLASEIWELEKQAHRALKKHKYYPMVHFAGHTECFKTIKPLEKIDWFTGDLFL